MNKVNIWLLPEFHPYTNAYSCQGCCIAHVKYAYMHKHNVHKKTIWNYCTLQEGRRLEKLSRRLYTVYPWTLTVPVRGNK